MAPTQHSVLALLSLAASVRAAPAGPIKDRQIGLTPPSQSVTWDTGNPVPTDPQGSYPPVTPPKTSVQISLNPPSVTWDLPASSQTPEYPPVYSSSAKPSEGSPSYSISWAKDEPAQSTPAPNVPQPSNQISLGKPSYWVSWETSGPAPSAPPTVPDYPPAQPSDEISLGKPSYSITWDGQGPSAPATSATPTPTPPKSTKKPPVYPPWTPIPPKSTPKSSQKPSSTPAYTPEPPKPSDNYSVTWAGGKRQDSLGFVVKPTYVPTPKPPPPPPKSSSAAPKPSSSKPKPSSSTPKPTPKPTPTPTPTPEEPYPEDPEPTTSTEDPYPTPPNTIGLEPPKASISWNKREAVPQDTIGLVLPSGISFNWPKPTTPSYFTWGKRQEDEEPTDIPDLPFPQPTDEISHAPPTATIIWGKREAEPQNSIGLEFPPGFSFNWPKPTPPSYFTWGKRQEDEEPTDAPELPLPQPTDEISQAPPTATIIWGKREAEPEEKRKAVPQDSIGIQFPPGFSWTWPKPTPPAYVSWGKRDDDDKYPAPTPTPTPTPVTPGPKPPVPSSSSCANAVVTVSPICDPPYCPIGVPCDWKLPVPALEKRVKSVEVVKTYVSIETISKPTPIKPTPSVAKCTPAKTKTIFHPCPTYTCVPTYQCDPAQIVR